MKRTLYVVGAGGHAKVVIATARAAGYAVDACYDDDPDAWGRSVMGVPCTGPIAAIEANPATPAVLAIGSGRAREALSQCLSCEWQTLVHPSSVVDSSVVLGPGTVVFAGAVIQPDARVGAHVIVNTCASIDHDSHVGDYCHLAPGSHLGGGVELAAGVVVAIGGGVPSHQRVAAWENIGPVAMASLGRSLPERPLAEHRDGPPPGRAP